MKPLLPCSHCTERVQIVLKNSFKKLDPHWQSYMPVLTSICKWAGKDLEGEVCNVSTSKAASAGVWMLPNVLRMTMTFSSVDYGSDISFTRHELFIVSRERSGSIHLDEKKGQSHGGVLRVTSGSMWQTCLLKCIQYQLRLCCRYKGSP